MNFFRRILSGNFFWRIGRPINSVLKKADFYIGWLMRSIAMKAIRVKKNRIVFFNCHNKYSCNPKSIIELLHKRNPDFEIIWVKLQANSLLSQVPPYIKCLERFSWEAFRAIMSAKIIIDNGWTYQEGAYVPKNNGQILIQTWHGSLGFKRFDTDKNKSRLRAAKRHGRLTDYCISNSTFETNEVYLGTFYKNSKILEFGHARNDILFAVKQSDELNQIRLKFNIPLHAVVVLYAPTFRDDKNKNLQTLDFNRVIKTIEKRYDKPCYILYRRHIISRQAPVFSEKVIDVSMYPEIQELLLITDIGITDYSSWLLDFSLTGRPGFLYAPDITSYLNERGFYYPLSTTPFPLSHSNDELISKIETFDPFQYKKDLKCFLKNKGCIEDGRATLRIVEFIEKLVKETTDEA